MVKFVVEELWKEVYGWKTSGVGVAAYPLKSLQQQFPKLQKDIGSRIK